MTDRERQLLLVMLNAYADKMQNPSVSQEEKDETLKAMADVENRIQALDAQLSNTHR